MGVVDRHGHLHDALGKFASDGALHIDRSGRRSPRGDRAFRPRATQEERRAAWNSHLDDWAVQKQLYDKRARGEPLTFKEKQEISWASPRKIEEQKAKTGDAIVPRSEALARFRQYAPKKSGMGDRGNRDEIVRNPRTGKLEARRTDRRVDLGGGQSAAAKRARRAFDLGRRGTPAPETRPAAGTPKFTEAQLMLSTNERLREMARSLGLEIPPRAGSRTLADLIRRHQGRT